MSQLPVSVSAITPTATSGCHILKIDGYSRTKLVATGKHMASSVFHAAGYSWRILYYPNGWDKKHSGHVSLFLMLTGGLFATNVHCEIKFALVPHRGGETIMSFVSKGTTFRCIGTHWGFPDFIKKEELESPAYAGFLKDDCFAVECSVAVMSSKVLVAGAGRDLQRLGFICGCDDDTCKRPHAPSRSVGTAAAMHERSEQSGFIKKAWLRLRQPGSSTSLKPDRK